MVVATASLVPKFGQEVVCQAVSKLFPEEIFRQFRSPMIEDLVNLAPFTTCSSWLCEQELAWDGALVPQLPCRRDSGKGHRMGSRFLLPFGLSPDEHFQCALARACEPTPFEQVPVLDTAQITAQHRASCARWT